MDKQNEINLKDMTDTELKKKLSVAVIAKELNDFFDKTPIELTYNHPNGEVEVLPDDFYKVINDITKQAIIPFVGEVLVELGYGKIPENAVVMTEEELFERDEKIHKADREYIKVLEECINNRNAKTRKETAEKFAERLKEKCKELQDEYSHICKNKFEAIQENCRYEGVTAVKNSIDEICKEIIGE